MKIAVTQSNYLPWKGYFDLIRNVDTFVLFDVVQYTKSDWRNRNIIKDREGNTHWLTLPISTADRLGQTIADAQISHKHWRRVHWEKIRHSYSRAPFFLEVSSFIEPVFDSLEGETSLSRVNRVLIEAMCEFLDIRTQIIEAPADLVDGKNERLLDLCKRLGATRYLTTPKARSYLDESAFRYAGIDVAFMNYDGYPEYPQPGVFDHHVSIIDLLFQTGKNASQYLLPLQESHSHLVHV
jgi:hypothetical protein